MAGSCEHGNESLGTVKGGEFLYKLKFYLAIQEELRSVYLFARKVG
jgi:hypothetical protein